MSAVTTHYRRVHGQDSASLGDLTWITLDSLKEPSASATSSSELVVSLCPIIRVHFRNALSYLSNAPPP